MVSKMLILSKSTSRLLYPSFIRTFSTTIRTAATLSSFPRIVNVSLEEKAAGFLTNKNLELANRGLYHDGLVVLENAISHEKLDVLNQKMVQDAKTLQAAGDESPFNYNKGFVHLISPKMDKQY